MAGRETLAQERDLVDGIRVNEYRKHLSDPSFIWNVCTNVSEAEETTLRQYFKHHSRKLLFTRTKYGSTHPLPQAGEEILRKIIRTTVHEPANYIGEHPVRFAENYRPGDHLELPTMDFRDARHQVRMAQLKTRAEAVGADSKLKIIYDAIVRAVAQNDHSGDSDIVCTRAFGTGCTHRNRLAVAFMSLHDFDPALLPAAMQAQGIERLISAKLIPSQIIMRDNWEQPGEYWIRESRQGLRDKEMPSHFYMGFYSGADYDTAEPYRHKYATVRKWYQWPGFTNNRQSVSVEMSSYGPFRIFDAELTIAGGTTMRVAPTGLEDYVQIVKGRNFVAKNGDPARLVPRDYHLVPKHVFNQVMVYLESKGDGSRLITAQVIRSKTISLKFDGQVLERGYEVDYDIFRDIVTTTHLLSMLNKRDEIHLCDDIKRTHDAWTHWGVLDWIKSTIKGWFTLPDTDRAAAADTLYRKIRPAQFQEAVVTSQYGPAVLLLPHAEFAEEAEIRRELGEDPDAIEPPTGGHTVHHSETQEYARRMGSRVNDIVKVCEEHNYEGTSGQTLRNVIMRAATVAQITQIVDLDLNNVTFITGPAGSGKSTKVNKMATGATAVITHSKVLARQWQLKCLHQVYTKHRFIVAAQGKQFATIIVDEASRWTTHDIALFHSLSPLAKIYVVGDMRQIQHADYEGLYERRSGEPDHLPRHDQAQLASVAHCMPTLRLRVNHRNPLGTVVETSRWLGADFVSHKTEDIPWTKTKTLQESIANFPTAVVMTFGHAMLEVLKHRYPDREIATVDAMMGSDVQDVILVVDEDSYPIQALQSHAHVYVAVTRQKGHLVITEADAEKLAKIMETAPAAFLNHDNIYGLNATMPTDVLRHDQLRQARVQTEVDEMPADTRMCDQLELESILQKHLPTQHDPSQPRAVTYDMLPPCERPFTVVSGGFTMDSSRIVKRRVLEFVSPRGKSTFGVKESVAATFMGRFGRKKPQLIYANKGQLRQKAKTLVDQAIKFAFRKDWEIDTDFFQRQVIKNVLNMYEKQTIKDVTVLEGLRYLVHLSGEQKKQHKVSASKDMTLANKNGQTIISIGKDAVNEFGPLAAGLAEIVHRRMKDQFKIHDGRSIQDSAGHLCAHVGSAQFWGTDLTEQDGSWNEMWNEFKKEFGIEMMMTMLKKEMKKFLNITEELFTKEFNRMINWDVLCRDAFRAAFEWMNHSGNSFTLIFNSLMSLAIIPEVFDFEGEEPLGLVYVGDDTLWATKRGKGKWKAKALAMAEWTLGVRIKQEPQTVPTICKHFVTDKGVFPNVLKMAMSAAMRPYRDAKDLEEYQISLRQDLDDNLKTEAQLKTAAAATATAHPAVDMRDARKLAGFLRAFSNWTWAQFERESIPLDIESKRVITAGEAASEIYRQWEAAAGTKFEKNPLLLQPLTVQQVTEYRPSTDLGLAWLTASRHWLQRTPPPDNGGSLANHAANAANVRPSVAHPAFHGVGQVPRTINAQPPRSRRNSADGGNADPAPAGGGGRLPQRTAVAEQVAAFEHLLDRNLEAHYRGGPEDRPDPDHPRGGACRPQCNNYDPEPEDRQALVPLAGRQLPLVGGPGADPADANNPENILGLVPAHDLGGIPIAAEPGRRPDGARRFGPVQRPPDFVDDGVGDMDDPPGGLPPPDARQLQVPLEPRIGLAPVRVVRNRGEPHRRDPPQEPPRHHRRRDAALDAAEIVDALMNI